MDGARIEQGPGEFSFGEDQGCTPQDGKRGHRSGTVGHMPAVLMTVLLHVQPVPPAVAPMDGFDILDPHFRAYVLPNAPLLKLGCGFARLEGPV